MTVVVYPGAIARACSALDESPLFESMPDGYIRAKMKQIVQLDMGAMEKADLEAIMAEIDAQEHKGA